MVNCARHAICMEDTRNRTQFYPENMKARDQLGNPQN
jgi:hypothetical protein